MNHYREIQSLLCQYGSTIDRGDLEACAELFTYGKWRLDGKEAMVGKEGFLEGLQTLKIYEDGTAKTKHLITNIDITLADDELSAKSESYVTVLQKTDDFPLQVIFSGHYYDDFKIIDGQWRYIDRTVRYELVGDMRAHLNYSPF